MSLKIQTIKAVLWASGSKTISQSLSWLVTILLARILSPDDFGLIGMAWILVSFLDVLNELGIGAAIIQRRNLDKDDLSSLFWFSIVSSAFMYSCAFVCAPYVAAFFHNSELTRIIRVLSVVLVIGTTYVIPFNLLTKELNFSRRSSAELIAVFAGSICSAILALLGFGVWSLVYGALLRNLAMAICLFVSSRWTPSFRLEPRRIKSMLQFGVSVAGSRILIYLYSNSDSFIIGRILGQKPLGYYSMALDLSNTPTTKITAILNQVTFPVFSKLQLNRGALREFFVKITKFVSLITLPIITGLFVVSEDLIRVVLTEKWLPMLIPFRILCCVALLKSADQIIPMLLYAVNKPNTVFRYTVACFAFLPVAFLAGSKFGLVGISLAFALIYPFSSAILFRNALKEIDLSLSGYIRIFKPAVTASCTMLAVVLLFQFLDRSFYGRSIHFRLIGSCLTGAVTYMASLAIFDRHIFDEIKELYLLLKSDRAGKPDPVASVAEEVSQMSPIQAPSESMMADRNEAGVVK
jgi:O-antigen/teichoic acid export membrane protein